MSNKKYQFVIFVVDGRGGATEVEMETLNSGDKKVERGFLFFLRNVMLRNIHIFFSRFAKFMQKVAISMRYLSNF